MVIRIYEIPEEGLFIPIEDSREKLDYGGLNYRIYKKITGSLRVRRASGRRIIVAGEVEAGLMLTCSRCLEEFSFEIKESFKDEFFPFEEAAPTTAELSKADLDTLFYVGDEIDLATVYLEKIYLAIPMKPLCKEDCKGLCPICGKNLNVESCDCKKKAIDPRWSALLALKEKLAKR